MFIPIGTDAPIYYRPFATIGLIAANVLLYFASFQGHMDGWQLQLGNGLHPVQWWTSAFFHYGLMHLLGNMVFLWTFGVIVEGKLAWWRFLPLYLALAGMDGAVTQIIMLGSANPEATAGGASGVIFALMAIALIWAPRNEIDVFYLVGFGLWFKSGVFQVSVMAFAAFYLAMNLLFAAIQGFRMSTEVLHVLGAAMGFPVACLMLKLDLVDCEGWDAFTLWRGRTLMEEIVGPAILRRDRPEADLSAAPAVPRKVSVDKRMQQLTDSLAARNPLAAWTAYKDLRERGRHNAIDAAMMRKLIDGLRVGKDWGNLPAVLEDYIARFPEEADRARLVLADLLIRREQRPRAALRALEPVRLADLPDAERAFAQKLRKQADRLINDGVMELSSS